MTAITLSCSNCGSYRVRYDEELGDAAPLTCAECDAVFNMTWGEAQKKLLEAGGKFVDDKIRDVFKGSKWKITPSSRS